MKRRLFAVLGLLLAAPSVALAITFFPKEVPDPFKPGATCKVQVLGSYGSYVYDWPSKYDRVFEPFIDQPMFWRCKGSGYVAHAADFDKTPEDRKAAVRAWLEAHPADIDKLDFSALLDRAQAIHEVRGMEDEWWAYFWRLRAVHASGGAAGDAYRAKALPLLQAQLQRTDLTSWQRMTNLYLVGYYARRGGQPDLSKDSFKAMREIAWTDKEGTLEQALTQFEPLIADIEAGKLNGDCGQTLNGPETCPALSGE